MEGAEEASREEGEVTRVGRVGFARKRSCVCRQLWYVPPFAQEVRGEEMEAGATRNIEKFRIVVGELASSAFDGRNGAFIIRRPGGVWLCVIASDGSGRKECHLSGASWEHVSVSLPDRCPTWGEMCWVKELFWGEDELVMQFHPPKKVAVNRHEYCLHLWKPVGVEIPLPPVECV